MYKLAWLAVAVILCATPAHAEDTAPAKTASREKVEELLEVMRVHLMVNQSSEAWVVVQIQQRPAFVDYRDVLRDFYSKYVGWEALKPAFIDAYIDEFTDEELDAIIAFYLSPAGRKSVASQTRIYNTVLESGMKGAQENMDELQEMINAKSELLGME